MAQPMLETFFPVKVVEVRRETQELAHLALADIPPEMKSAYTTPGQHVRLHSGDEKASFFSIANGPGRDTFEILIKRGTPIPDRLSSTKAGERLWMSTPAGAGFPIAKALGTELYLIGVGSGIAPLRAVVHAALNQRFNFKSVRLFYGARTAESMPYVPEMDAWQRQGIAVTRVCSKPETETWNGITGRVHEALRASKPVITKDTSVFACGMKLMVEDLKTTFGSLGLPPERIFLNF
jgi:NAD(P)H-flavin reductase